MPKNGTRLPQILRIVTDFKIRVNLPNPPNPRSICLKLNNPNAEGIFGRTLFIECSALTHKLNRL